MTALCVGARCQRREEGPYEAADGLRTCYGCRDATGRDALAAARLYEDLALVLTGGGSKAERVSGTRESVGLNIDDTAAEERAAIRSTLAGWCRNVAEDRGVSLPQDTVVSMALFLRTHADWLARQDFAGDVSAELADVAWRGRRVAYRVPSDAVFIGTCPITYIGADVLTGVVGQVPCGERLFVAAGSYHAVECRGCGTVEPLEWWQQRIVGDVAAHATAVEIAALLSQRFMREVERGQIREWWRAGRVARVGVDDRKRPLYDTAAVVEYADSVWGEKAEAS